MPARRAVVFQRYLNRIGPRQAILAGFGSLLLLAVIDYSTSIDVSFAIFYLIPVMIVAWCLPMGASVLMCLLAAATSEAISELVGGGYSSAWVYVWAPGTKFLIFLLVSFLLHELRVTYRELHVLSSTDALTGVSNRGSFIQSLEVEISRHRRSGLPLALAYIDLDNFKQANDTFGHQKGDDALKAVAETLLASLRRSDIVGRIGGDEFAVLMPETQAEDALVALSAARGKTLHAMAALGLQVTFSAGVVSAKNIANADRLIQHADALMYEVKKDGRNGIRPRNLDLDRVC